MKSEKGITLTSLIIYIIALTIIISIVGTVTRVFYKNITNLDKGTSMQEFVKFNMYLTKEINIENNYIKSSDNLYDGEILKQSEVTFGNTNNKFVFKNNTIFFNEIKLCENIDSCEFEADDNGKSITVHLKIDDNVFTNTYKIV